MSKIFAGASCVIVFEVELSCHEELFLKDLAKYVQVYINREGVMVYYEESQISAPVIKTVNWRDNIPASIKASLFSIMLHTSTFCELVILIYKFEIHLVQSPRVYQ